MPRVPFAKGNKLGKGRPKGSPNKKTVEKNLLTRAAELLDGQEYFDNVKSRILRGRAPHAESYLLRRVKGDPTQHVELAGNEAKPIRVTIQVVRG